MEDDRAIDETRPLLADEEQARTKSPKKATPLPVVQIGLLLFAQLTEPITSQSLLPYINELISKLDITGGDRKAVGYYAGLIESLYFAAEACTVLQWGRLSDHIGRKPVLLIGLTGLAISFVLFGLSSSSFWALALSRALCGALNGNIGVMKSAMGELTDRTNRARGFALMPVMWALGASVGPLMGGTLSRPADQFPGTFDTPFWRRFPYFLPSLIGASFTVLIIILVALFLKETLPKEKIRSPSESSTATQNSKAEEVRPLRELLTKPVILAVANYAALAFLDIAMACMGPLFYSTPIEFGGLGMSPAQIGLFLGLYGVIDGVAQFLFFPIIVERIGVKPTLFIAMSAFVPIFLWFPVAHQIARHSGFSAPVYVALGFQMLFMGIMDMAYAVTFMYITASAPSQRSLGSVNGLAQTMISIIRTIGPAMATSLFAVSIEENLVGGNLVYIIFVVLSVLSLFLVAKLPAQLWHLEGDSEDE
ncbi:MFS general substrate transporter [Peniophora sp. CONT]|nr:MFS general substrate transporter [Peniophora sp. CONT]